MSRIGGLLAYIDNLKRVGARNVRDMVQNPDDFGRMASALANTAPLA